MVIDFGGRMRPPRTGQRATLSGENGRPRWRLPAIVAGVLATALIVLYSSSGFWVNLWWFESLGFRDALTTRYTASLLSFLLGTAIAALFLTANVAVVVRAGRGQPLQFGGVELPQQLGRAVVIGGAAILALFFGLATANEWELFLRYLHQVPWGATDPQFGHDISFFVFTLPVITFWRAWTTALIVFTAAAVGVLYAARMGASLTGGGFRLPLGIRGHASVLGALFLATTALGYWVDAQELVYSTRGVVIGASYTEVNAQLPANYILLGITAVAAVLLLVNAVARQIPLLIGTLVVWAVAAILVGSAYPAAVQSLRVRPNELDAETPYIARNITATRDAYNIAKVTTMQATGVGDPTRAEIIADAASVQNVRLWDYRPLLATYGQLQQIRQYYQFTDVDVARYTIDGQYRQIMLAARELNPDLLALQSRTWQNQHLIYTHGYGAVASYANEVVGEGRPRFILSNIPPTGPTGLTITEPRIYFGEVANKYALVRTKQQEFDRPAGDDPAAQSVYSPYTGGKGVSIGDPMSRLVFAAYLGETKVLLSGDITGESQILLRRTIDERLRSVAPFLRYDRDPYLALVDGRLVWINDAYTATALYPYATRTAAQPTGIGADGAFNYIRNSVKATVDAYDGTVRLYVTDPTDPIIRTYQRIYPSLFQADEAVSPALRAQFRYPEDLFNVQSSVLTRYHVTVPNVFYGSEDQWAVANELVGPKKEIQPIEAYYVLLRLPGEQKEEFALVRPFTPGGTGASTRQNMVSIFVARCDGENYGKLVSYEFPRQVNVQGPQQIESRINQEPDISKEITLLDQSGSQVILGNLLIIPVGNSLLYVEPLYVQATNSPFPELKRVIVASQSKVVMRNNLPDAINALLGSDTPVLPQTSTGTSGVNLPAMVPGDQRMQAQDALNHYQRAQDALKTGDFATFGSELALVQQILQQLSGTPAPAVPVGTPPSGTPVIPTVVRGTPVTVTTRP